MLLTQEQIQRLGNLTALKAIEDLNISSVIESFKSLQGTDISGVGSISRSGQGELILREDRVVDSTMGDALLACSHQRKASRQIMLGGIMIGE